MCMVKACTKKDLMEHLAQIVAANRPLFHPSSAQRRDLFGRKGSLVQALWLFVFGFTGIPMPSMQLSLPGSLAAPAQAWTSLAAGSFSSASGVKQHEFRYPQCQPSLHKAVVSSSPTCDHQGMDQCLARGRHDRRVKEDPRGILNSSETSPTMCLNSAAALARLEWPPAIGLDCFRPCSGSS